MTAATGSASRDETTTKRRWGALATVFALMVVAVAVLNARDFYVADNRFEWYWSPGRVLSRLPSLWDGSRGIGRPRGEFSLVPWCLLALFRGFGASPALAERLLHATLLTAAGVGAVLFLQALRPSLGPEHAVAGLFYAFNPFSAVFLVPSGLFLNYALAPWLLLSFVRGSREDHPWRWAAVFSLAVLASGSTDPPGLVYSLALLGPTGLYVGLVERGASWRQMGAWLARAAVLSGLVSAAALAQVAYGSTGLATRLFSTESVEAVHRTVSWAESWRGLGFWTSYFSEGGRPLRPEQGAYFWSAPAIVATFLAPCVALLAFGWSQWKPRLLMAGLVLVSLTLMVGSFPPDNPSPLGRILRQAYDRLPALTALRTSYKAGAGLALGVACLLGLAVAEAGRRLSRGRHSLGAVPVLAAVAIMAVAAFPFWTGKLYPTGNRMRALPEYWRSATAWLDRQPGEGRVLVVPGSSNSRYRWGSPGDDIFDALLTRPHVVDESLPLSTAQAGDLVAAIGTRAQSDRYQPGTLAPVARRLGVEYVVIRNDLDWRVLERPRPLELQALRDDADLERVATFGRPGQNVIDAHDHSASARAEASLPPVEVYRVKGASGPVRVAPVSHPLLLSGDGEGWFSLAAGGLLDGTGPVQYTAATESGELLPLLRDGARVAVTDTNRRRVTFVTRFGRTESHTLGAGEDLDRRAGQLFERPGSQTVATFADATRITSTATGGSLSGYEPWSRPANAFDGDEGTAWLTEGLQQAVGNSVRVDLRRPAEVSTVEVVASPPAGTPRTVSAATLVFSDGTTVPVDLRSGRARVSFPPRRTDSVEVRIDAVEGPALGPAGFSEIRLGSLDLVEWMQVPDDLFRAADANAALAEELARTPATYLFERLHADVRDAEPTMRRRFRSVGRRQHALSGTLRLGRDTPDEVVDALVGGPVGAFGSSRHQGELGHRGGLAVDGRPETGWRAPAQPGAVLTVRFPPRPVDRIEVTSAVGDHLTPVTRARVRVGTTTVELELEPTEQCHGQPSAEGPRCPVRGVTTLPPVHTDRLTIEITQLGRPPSGLPEESAVEVSEVGVGPATLPPGLPAASARLPTACLDDVIVVDGRSSPVQVDGATEDLVTGRPVSYAGCQPVLLDSGWHRLQTRSPLVETASLATLPPPTPALSAAQAPVEVISGEPTRLRVRIRSPEHGAVLVTGHSHDQGWTATLDGRDLGSARALDTQAGWVIRQEGMHVVDVRYQPQRAYQLALALTLTGIVACVWILVAWRRTP